jgi:hypothetical protein
MIRTLSLIAAFALSPLVAAAQPSDFVAAKVQAFSAGPLPCCGGATTETNIASIRVPGGSMGPVGAIDLKCLWSYPNSANNKTLLVRFTNAPGSIGGGVISGSLVVTTTVASQTEIIIRNIAVNSQVSWIAAPTTPFGSAGTAPATLALDTSADTYLNINAITASGAETITLNHCIALVMRP